ncbi:hypothetical protein B0T25DRAFT_536586 [Lasiosphaeria hispida]|uniref:Uncharacterized protein n=1 Tax=Lasiosphaeria hispida TaxID=260671 RepID=A0AAJ0HK42_9PEZI|nr:hypothetical protein B0T25DRAFT_536586 [Lasiosphaeria hispida]
MRKSSFTQILPASTSSHHDIPKLSFGEDMADYTQGFGSFDFRPRASPETVPRFVSTQRRNPRLPAVLPAPFPFMRLPLAIRTKIYQILLTRLYPGRHLHLHKDAVNGGVRFKVNDAPYVPGWLEVDYGLQVTGYTDSQSHQPVIKDSPSGQGIGIGSSSDVGSDGERSIVDDIESDYAQSSPGSVSPIHFIDVAVERSMNPDPECDPACHNDYSIDDCMCCYRTPDEYYECLELSQVSRQFTAELGMSLWQNATVELVEPSAFLLFARSRPSTLPHIRGIVLHVQYHGDPFDTPAETLREICAFVTENLTVRFFTAVLSTDLILRQDASSGHELAKARLQEAGAVFRGLEIDGVFDIRLNPEYPLGHLAPPKEKESLLGALREAWLPPLVRGRK